MSETKRNQDTAADLDAGIGMLVGLGFSVQEARDALKATNGDVDDAIDTLLSGQVYIRKHLMTKTASQKVAHEVKGSMDCNFDELNSTLEEDEVDKKPPSRKNPPLTQLDYSTVSAVLPNPRPVPPSLCASVIPSRHPRLPGAVAMQGRIPEANTHADIETGIILDANEQSASPPTPSQPELQLGAIAVEGIDSSDDDYSIADPSISGAAKAAQQTASSDVQEIAATLVDQDEEARKRQEQVDKEVKKKLEEERERAEVADIVTGFWCTPKAMGFIALGISLVVVLAIVAIVLGTVLPQVLEPPPPTLAPTSASPTSPPTAAPTSLLPGLTELLSSASFDGGIALATMGTPQNKALNWLANNTFLVGYSDDKKIQRYVLVTLYYSTNGDAWTNNDGWLSDNDECLWYKWKSPYTGAESDFCFNGSVVELVLYGNNLVGTIPAELALLSNSLEGITLGSNVLTGSIPSEIGLLTRLTTLKLRYNDLEGTTPPGIGLLTKLNTLWLGDNALTGTIPSEIGLMTDLSSFSLGFNKLSGTIPSDIGLITNFDEFVDLSDNALSGTIPLEIGHLTKLTHLSLHKNALIGRIPSEIGLMSSLNWLTLYNNTFTGNFTCPNFIHECFISCDDELEGHDLNSPCRTL